MSKLSPQAWTKSRAGLIFLSRNQQVAPDFVNPTQTLLQLLFAEALQLSLDTLSWDVSGAARAMQHFVLSRALVLCQSHPIWTDLPSPAGRALNAPISFNGPDQPYLEPPHTPHLWPHISWGPGAPFKVGSGPCFGYVVGIPLLLVLWMDFGLAL